MAGMAGSSRDLWQIISGSSVLRPKPIVGAEIKRNTEKLIRGLSYYSKPRHVAGDRLKTERKLEGTLFDFVQKLSGFLSLDELCTQCLFLSFLRHDYRGTEKDLKTYLVNERHSIQFMKRVQEYYYSERIYLLRCVKVMFSSWQDEDSPYREEYNTFMETAAESDRAIIEILNQYDEVCEATSPSHQFHSAFMAESQLQAWMRQNLKEQVELLELMLLYYKDFEHSCENLLKLATKFKKQGFGYRQVNKHLLDETMETLVKRIGYLQVLIIIEGIDTEFMYKCQQVGSPENHHIIKSPEFKELDALICSLGDNVEHSPVLLLWAAVRQIAFDVRGMATTKRLGDTSLQLNVFTFLNQLLESEPFCGATILGSCAHVIVHGLLTLVLSVYHEETLGGTQMIYQLASQLLQNCENGHDFWTRSQEEGMTSLLDTATLTFPLEFTPLLKLSTALAKSGVYSSQKIQEYLKKLPVYTEYLTHNRAMDLQGTTDELVWKLARNKMPYNTDKFIIPKGTCGQVLAPSGGNVIQWEYTYNGWQLFICEAQTLLVQISHGAGMVSAETVEHVIEIAKLSSALLESDPTAVTQMLSLLQLFFPVIHRFSLIPNPPLELLSACLQVITVLAQSRPLEVWHDLQQIGLLPYFTENFDDLREITSGSGLAVGSYGNLLVSLECPLGRYPITTSILQLMNHLIKPMSAQNRQDELLPCVVFIMREVFPVFYKWRYYDFSRREIIGQKCLEIFHKILNLMNNNSAGKQQLSERQGLQKVVVYGLLFTEAGHSLLDIISTGVDVVEAALADQGSASEGVGVELIHLIRFGFSVLNRLLMLRDPSCSPSPVEHCLSVQPVQRSDRHVVSTIAQYIYHRHDARLPTLATLLLKRLALVFPMSLLACLGNDASAIKDMFLARLQAVTEDMRLKVVILQWLAVSIHTQPGLTEMFLNVHSLSSSADQSKSTESAVGQRGCLQIVLQLIAENKQGTYQCPSDLLCASVELLKAIWYGRKEMAMASLKEKEEFWPCVCLSIMRDLRSLEEVDMHPEVLKDEIQACANIFHILAMELFGWASDKPDEKLQKVLQTLIKEKRLQYWSQYLCQLMKLESGDGQTEDAMSENCTLQLLNGMRMFLVVLAGQKDQLTVPDDLKNQLLNDLLDGIAAQCSNGLSKLSVHLASVGIALYFTLFNHWQGSVKNWKDVLLNLESLLSQTCSNSETLIPPIQIGILGALTMVLQFIRNNKPSDVDCSSLGSLLGVVCRVLQHSTYQLKPLSRSQQADTDKTLATKLKLQTLTVTLVEELIGQLRDADHWLPILQEHAVIPSLLNSALLWMQARQGIQYVHAVLQLFMIFSRSQKSAEALAINGLTHHTCLVAMEMYSQEEAAPTEAHKEASREVLTWQGIYCVILRLYSSMLETLSFTFVEDALNFVGAHQERMQMCLESIHMVLCKKRLVEVEHTCRFLLQLSHYSRQWRLHLPHVLNNLLRCMASVSHICTSMLIRPRLLQLALKKQSGKDSPVSHRSDRLTMEAVSKRLQSQTSTEDVEQTTPELHATQLRLLQILCDCLGAMRQFSPDLTEILLDQSMDISEYEPLLLIGFSTPSVEQEPVPTFGTLVSCTNICLKMLTRLDPKSSTSPVRTPESIEASHLTKSLVTFALENALVLMMSQAVRYLKEPAMPIQEKQLLRRELAAELTSFLTSIHRYMRRSGPPSPASTAHLSPDSSTSKSSLFSINQDQTYFKMVDRFIQQVLR